MKKWPDHVVLVVVGMWLGMLLFVGYGVAGTIFNVLDSRTQAGQINGIILARMNRLEWFFGGVLMAVAFIRLYWRRNARDLLQASLAIVSLMLLFVYSGPITRTMEEKKAVIQNFDIPKEADSRPERAEFDRWHQWYSGLVKANIVMLAGTVLVVGFRKESS